MPIELASNNMYNIGRYVNTADGQSAQSLVSDIFIQ